MWDVDNFPGADKVPWQLLIRARFEHEIDAVIASIVVHTVAQVASPKITESLAKASTSAIKRGRQELTADRQVGAMVAVADFDDWCGTVPFKWPPRPKGYGDFLSDPILEVVLGRAQDLIRAAGSSNLNKAFDSVLREGGLAA